MVDSVLFMGGILNVTLFGIPLYFFSWAFLLVIAGLIWLVYSLVSWKAFEPLHGIYYAFKAKSKAAFIFNVNLQSELISEAKAKCIFDYAKDFAGMNPVKYDFKTNEFVELPILPGPLGAFQRRFWYYPSAFLDIDLLHGMLYKLGGANHDVEIAKKMQNYEWDAKHSVTSGGVLIDMIFDANNWSVQTSPEHKICVRLAEVWNEQNPKDQVHAYSKLQRYINEGKIAAPYGFKSTFVCKWARTDCGCPVIINNNAMAGARRQMAADLVDQNKHPFDKWLWPLILAGGGIAVLILLMRFALHFI